MVRLALACAAATLPLSCGTDVIRAPSARPNIVFISIDTLRADHIGAYGDARASTPTLDALAAQGVLFEKAVSHVPMTLPSHASMFTSLTPPRHGVRDNGTFVLGQRHETLAEVLGASGYRTGAFVGAFVLDAQFGLDQGFERYDDDVEGTAENDRGADEVLDATRHWIDEAADDVPWFAFVHLFDPHAPYEPPGAFAERFASDPYAGEIAYVDDALGRFLRELPLDNTLVVVTSDHGEGLGEHKERTHGMFGYESTLHVPLLFHWRAGLPGGRRVPSRVRHVDVAPTILELVGIEPPATFDGLSLAGLLAGQSEPDRTSYFESFTYTFNYGSAPLRGVYEEQFKLVALPIIELYDLSRDPGELDNLASQRAGTVERMAKALEQLAGHVSATPTTLDERARERLEALGYVSGANPLPKLDEFGPADDPKNWTHLADMLDQAVAHHRAQRPAEAIELLRGIIAEKDDAAIAYARLARIFHEQGRSEDGIAMLEDALANGISHPNIVTALGVFLREAGRESDWSRVLEGVVERRASDAAAHEALAASLMRQGLDERALPHLQRFVELEPEQYDTLVQIGLVLADLGRTDEARGYLERFMRAAPDDTYREDKIQVRAFLDELAR